MSHQSSVARRPVLRAMSIALAAALCSTAPCPAQATGSDALIEHIDAILEAGDHARAVDALDEYLAEVPDDARMQYNAACVHAQLGDLETAEAHLRSAMRNGFMRFSTMQRDPDLAPLRDRPVLQSMLAARDAADGIIAGRRNDHWLDELGGRYRLVHDRSRNIDFISALDDQTQQIARQRLAEVADDLAGFFGHTLQQRITIVLLTDDDAATVFGNSRVRGNYRHERRELVVTNFGRSLQHELAHAFHHSHMDALHQQHPMWVQEGLGCLFEAYERDEAGELRFLPNDRHASMVYLLESDRAERWRKLIEAGSERFRQDAIRLYPQCRSVFEFVAARSSARAWYEHYTGHYASDLRGGAALAAVLDAELRDAEAAWRTWVLQRCSADDADPDDPVVLSYRMPASSSPAPSAPSSPPSGPRIVVHVNPQANAAQSLYDTIRPTVLAGEYAEAIPTLEQVIAMQPDHADARYDLALGYIRTGSLDAARQQCARLRELDTNLATMVAACLRSVDAASQ